MEVTDKRAFVLWERTLTGRTRFDPVIYSSAAAAITTGEKRKDKGEIKEYNYSVVMQPDIH
jgi:hypothetical protein